MGKPNSRTRREELVDELLGRAFMTDANVHPKHRKPGQVIAKMPEELRRELAQLTAADFQRRIE